MKENKIGFIICATDSFLAEECVRYINNLVVPDGFSIEIDIRYKEKSMTSGYNKAMQKSDAKYKVYLHQDVLLINRHLLIEAINIFQKNAEIGMLGVVGNTSLAKDGCPWSDGMERRIGEIYSDLIDKNVYSLFRKAEGNYQPVVVLDGLFMMTQYDIRWREDLFFGWDFYDCSQSLEFWKAGYKVVVPYMDRPWCLHDNDILHLQDYEKWRNVFEQNYREYYECWKTEQGEPEELFYKKIGKLNKSKDARKKLVYQLHSFSKEGCRFPYPPIYREEDADYICFYIEGKNQWEFSECYSAFWKMEKISDISELQEILDTYEEKFELKENQIQAGPVFTVCEEYAPIITVPSLYEIPEIEFDSEKINKTADAMGNYKYKRNNINQGGKYKGRPLLLTIGVPVSNQIDTIERCLSHIKPLLDNLPSELIVIDTGSTDGTVEVCRSYGARVIEYPWCDDMSRVRNQGINNAKGLWYMSIDDDEWFESVEEILNFFQKGLYKKADTATYIQRNYLEESGKTYEDNHTRRMAEITPELHFEGRIHDAMKVSKTAVNCLLSDYAHHYGFADVKNNKYIRNVSILLQDVYEYPESLRYNFQLANEFKCSSYESEMMAFSFRGIAMAMEKKDNYYGSIHVVNLLAGCSVFMDKRLYPYAELLKDLWKLTAAEKAFISYYQAAIGIRYHRNPEGIYNYFKAYKKYLEEFNKNPYDSRLNSYTGLYICEDEAYLRDGEVIGFYSYAATGQNEKAMDSLRKIDPEKIYDQQSAFFEGGLIFGDEIFDNFIQFMTSQEEIYGREMIETLFRSWMCDNENREKIYTRFLLVLSRLSISFIDNYMNYYAKKLEDVINEILIPHAINAKTETCFIQELFLYKKVMERNLRDKLEAGDTEYFLQYICLSGAFVSAYYYPSLLENGNAINKNEQAAYEIYRSLQKAQSQRDLVIGLRNALQIFPGYKKGIEALMKVYLGDN